jgi:hypothetical protein
VIADRNDAGIDLPVASMVIRAQAHICRAHRPAHPQPAETVSTDLTVPPASFARRATRIRLRMM